jgi:erythromycin esterase
MRARRIDYLRLTTLDSYERALRCLDVTVALDALWRASALGDRHEMMVARDATIADSVEWILRRERRVVLGAHNAHIQRWPADLPGMAPATTMGAHLADRLGRGYVVIGATSGTRRNAQ